MLTVTSIPSSFVILSTEKPFKILPKQNGYNNTKYFAFELIYFYSVSTQKTVVSIVKID